MTIKKTPFDLRTIETLSRTIPTPFHIYDETAIVRNARKLKEAFSWNAGFKEYFAVKAAPNPFLMQLLAAEGFGCDCSSLPELILSERIGVVGEDVMFTSNDTPAEEFRKARDMGAIINLDDISHIPFLEREAGIPEIGCLRYNPGKSRSGNVIIGKPEEAKYGLTRPQLFEGYKLLQQKGATRFGLHAMIASNELNADYFVQTAVMLFDLIAEISRTLNIKFEFVNIGGGIGIPYRPEDKTADIFEIGRGVEKAHAELVANGLPPLSIFMECGRAITGPYGWLVSRVLHLKNTYKRYVGLDASMADLMRPALYGAYHHITVLGKEDAECDTLYDVTGSLCENNDKFAIDRHLPEVVPGDLLAIHDTGAHGHAMGFNYNGKLRSAELLLRPDGSFLPIRRAETVDDYFATLDFNALSEFKPAAIG